MVRSFAREIGSASRPPSRAWRIFVHLIHQHKSHWFGCRGCCRVCTGQRQVHIVKLQRQQLTVRLSEPNRQRTGCPKHRLNPVLEISSASTSDGYTTKVDAGSWSMIYPMMLRIASVPPTWVDLIKTISSIRSSEKASMIPLRYGVFSVFHRPGWLDVPRWYDSVLVRPLANCQLLWRFQSRHRFLHPFRIIYLATIPRVHHAPPPLPHVRYSLLYLYPLMPMPGYRFCAATASSPV